MIPRSTMLSDYSMNISTGRSGCRNAASMLHSSATLPSYLLYKGSPIRILVDVSIVTGENDSIQPTPGTRMCLLTTFIDFNQIKPSGSSLILSSHLKGTGFLLVAFTMILLIKIRTFLDRFFFPEIYDIFHECPSIFVIYSFSISGSPVSA